MTQLLLRDPVTHLIQSVSSSVQDCVQEASCSHQEHLQRSIRVQTLTGRSDGPRELSQLSLHILVIDGDQDVTEDLEQGWVTQLFRGCVFWATEQDVNTASPYYS